VLVIDGIISPQCVVGGTHAHLLQGAGGTVKHFSLREKDHQGLQQLRRF
jgi:hypothetical protein